MCYIRTTLTFFFLTLTISQLSAQEDNKTIRTDIEWATQYFSFSDGNSNTSLSRFKDTLVVLDGNEYYPLEQSRNEDFSDPKLYGHYYRESNDTIFQWTSQGEFIVMNFNLNAGDTILYGTEVVFIDIMEVVSVDSVETLIGRKKRLTVQCTSGLTEWIEGIGNIYFGYGDMSVACAADAGGLIICASQNGEQFYQHDSADGCFITNTEEIKPTLDISIYPNPAQEQITIDIDRPVEWLLYNSSARYIKTGAETSISLDNLPAGLYYLKVIKNDTFQFKKFIKQ